ncbi:MAG: ABC transporter substrate-binding protein [Ktedonobacteraceae bacterium]|nr:ABC transporter substrate-binding protein [Ktedonobacteraceae bacterium]
MFSPFPGHKKQKRTVFLALPGIFTVFLLVLAACGTPVASNNPPATPTGGASKPSVAAPKNLITPGVLTVGSDTTYPPQEYIDPQTQKPAGFDIDLINAIAAKMGLRANVQTANFDTIIESLAAKRYDVVISAVTINEERKAKADFIPYFNAGESLLVRKGNPKNIKSVTDLCGLNAGVQNGTVEQPELENASKDCKKAGKPEIKITALKNQTDVIQLLATNRVDATYQDSPVTDYYLKQHSDQFEVGGSVVNVAQEGIVVRKGDTEMFNAIQSAFNQVKADGTYRSLIEKWGLTSGAIAIIDERPRATARVAPTI